MGIICSFCGSDNIIWQHEVYCYYCISCGKEFTIPDNDEDNSDEDILFPLL
jgi:hypothetical protein